MASNFHSALRYTLAIEKGYTNDPDDSGGPTNFGITQETLAQYLGRPVSPTEISQLPPKLAETVYYQRYWRPLNCGRLTHASIATAIFDAGVLFGINASANAAQMVLKDCGIYSSPVDGYIGNLSISGLNVIDPMEFMPRFVEYLKRRIVLITEKRPKDLKFKKGWESRVDRLKNLVGGVSHG